MEDLSFIGHNEHSAAIMPRSFPSPRNDIHLLCDVDLQDFQLVQMKGESIECWHAPNAGIDYERYLTSWWRMGDGGAMFHVKPPLKVFLNTLREKVLGISLRKF